MEEFDGLIQRAMALARTDPGEALSLAERAHALAFAHPDAGEKIEALRVLAAILHEAGEPDRSRDVLNQGLALLPQCADPGRRSRFHLAQGWLAFLHGELDEALAATLAALAEDLPLDSSRCWGHNNLGLIYRALGSLDRALGCFLEARRASQTLGLALTEGAALINLSVLHCDQGDFVAALDAAYEAIPLVDSSPDEYAKTAGRGHLIDALIGLARFDEAEEICEGLLGRRQATAMCRVIGHVHQGRIRRLRGDFPTAELALNAALRETKRGRLFEQQIQVQHERALLREAEGRLSAAARILRDALTLAERAGLRTEEAALLDAAARVAETRKQYRVALEYVRRFQLRERERMDRAAENQRILFTIELELEKARREAQAERLRSDRLQDEASRDGMTGLFHHATFQKTLRLWLAEGPLALILLDVDGFKSYNDTHGHVAGDVLLQELARVLDSTVRDGDLLARYGGEEFAVLLRGEGLDRAAEIGERLRLAVEGHRFAHAGITVSVGIAASPPCPPDPSALVESADRALYRAKRAGKNRVVVAASLGKL